jgi:hypothetical protein
MIRRIILTLGGIFMMSMIGGAAAHASGFFSVLTEQTEPVVITLPVIELAVGQTTQAVASGGSGDGAYSFATATSSKCTISATGVITGVAIGNCSVTATKAAAGLFLDRTSASVTFLIKTEPDPTPSPTPTPGSQSLSSPTTSAGPSYSVDFNLTSGTETDFSWSGAERVLVSVTTRAGARENEFQAGSEKKGRGFVDGLIPGYVNKVTVADFSGTWSKSVEIAVPPIKITGISATSATSASNFTYTLKWRPQSYLEYYRVVVTTPAGEVLSYWTKTPDWRLNDKAPGRYLFEITAQGEGDSLSEPVRFAATVTTPINISSKLPTNPASNRLTTFTSSQLKSIANRLTAQTVVTVTTYYDPKIKGAKKLASKRIARAAATLKVTKSTLEVRTQVRRATSQKSLTQISLSTKAPARRLALTNV